MAQDITSENLATIAAGGYAIGWSMQFDLPSGLYAFWSGSGPLTISGLTYIGSGALIDIEQLAMGTDLSAAPVTARLRAVPEQGLTPDVLATIDDEDYKGRPVAINLLFFDRATGGLALSLRIWRGYIDNIDHDWSVGVDYALVAHLEPRSLDHSRRGFRTRGDADQRLIDPTDTFYLHAATVASEQLPYGRATAAVTQDQFARFAVGMFRGGG